MNLLYERYLPKFLKHQRPILILCYSPRNKLKFKYKNKVHYIFLNTEILKFINERLKKFGKFSLKDIYHNFNEDDRYVEIPKEKIIFLLKGYLKTYIIVNLGMLIFDYIKFPIPLSLSIFVNDKYKK